MSLTIDSTIIDVVGASGASIAKEIVGQCHLFSIKLKICYFSKKYGMIVNAR